MSVLRRYRDSTAPARIWQAGTGLKQQIYFAATGLYFAATGIFCGAML